MYPIILHAIWVNEHKVSASIRKSKYMQKKKSKGTNGTVLRLCLLNGIYKTVGKRK